MDETSAEVEAIQQESALVQLALNGDGNFAFDEPFDEYDCSSIGGSNATGLGKEEYQVDYNLTIEESDDDDMDSDDDLLDGDMEPTTENCLALNLAYQEVLFDFIRDVETALAQNREQQQHISDQLEKIGEDTNRQVSKVPVALYLPPYFKDPTGMCPPPNSDAVRKAMTREFDPQVEPPKLWVVKEKQKLLDSVRAALMEFRLKPLESEKDLLQDKLAAVELAEEDSSDLTAKMEKIDFEITEIKSLPDEKILVPPYNEIDWVLMANNDFKGSRTPAECQLFWLNQMRPGLNQAVKWDKAEEKKLRQLVKKYADGKKKVDWDRVSEELDSGRTAFHCFQKHQTEASRVDLRRKPWSPEEDMRLQTMVDSCRRAGDYVPWEQVGSLFEGRTRTQCYLRYTRTLNPNLRRGKWSEEEDLKLFAGVTRHGPKAWYKVAEFVPGRTDTQCRERWVSCLDAGVKIGVWTKEEDEKLKLGVKMFGDGSWTKISGLLDGRNPATCKVRYRTITKTRKYYARVNNVPVRIGKNGKPWKQRKPRGPTNTVVPYAVRLERAAPVLERKRQEREKLRQMVAEAGGVMPKSLKLNSLEFLAKTVDKKAQQKFRQKLEEIHKDYGDFERELLARHRPSSKSSKARNSVAELRVDEEEYVEEEPRDTNLHDKVEAQLRRAVQRNQDLVADVDRRQSGKILKLMTEDLSKTTMCFPPTITTCRAYGRVVAKESDLKQMQKNFHVTSAATTGKKRRKSSRLVKETEPETADDKLKEERDASLEELLKSDEYRLFEDRCRAIFTWPAIIAALPEKSSPQ